MESGSTWDCYAPGAPLAPGLPDGPPEQITFGSNEEGGVAVAPDGRSLITSILSTQNSVWIHDTRGERAVSTEGYAESKLQCSLGTGSVCTICCAAIFPRHLPTLARRSRDRKERSCFTGILNPRYDISNDETDAVFSIQPAGQASELWIAPLDRSAPPRRIAASGEAFPYLGPKDELLFRMSDGTYYMGAMKRDGSGERKAVLR